MSESVRALLEARKSGDEKAAYAALGQLFKMADEAVPWAYDVWDDLRNDLERGDNHDRAFAAQLLARLAKSDPERRIFRAMPALERVMRDDKFVTARHTVQTLWRVGTVSGPHTTKILAVYTKRYHDCVSHKNAHLIRSDIILALAQLASAVGVAKVEKTVRTLLDAEPDASAKKKQEAVWRRATKSPEKR